MIIEIKHVLTALSLASVYQSDSEIGSWLPPEVWERLRKDGLIAPQSVSRGMSIEQEIDVATPKGLNFLKKSLQ